MAVSLAQFVNRIADSGLLARGDVQSLIDAVPTGKQPKDGQQLARLLVKQKKLTAYQAQQLYAGKGRSLILGNYVVLDKLGQGGMGMVLKAEHKRMERVVALKVLSPNVTKTQEALARFQREVKAAAKLNHTNIVIAHDADEAGRTHFLVMEYVEGSDLSVLVKEKGPLSVDHAVNCTMQAARGLDYAHGRGVVHRDIKPSNLLLDREGTVKILDMGLARLESAGADQDQLTGTGQIMGTIDYMAPEQALDTKNADARADIYALGITLWYLLTGRAAYAGESVMAKLLAHREAAIPSLSATCSDASPQLDEIFTRMVAKQPEDRYQTMREVIADLDKCRRGADSSPSLATRPGDDSQLDAFLNNLPQTSGSRQASRAVADQPKQASQTAPGLDRTVSFQSIDVDTDPETQHSLAVPAGGNGKAHEAAGPARRTHKSERSIGRLSVFVPRSRVTLLCAAGGGAVLLLAAIIFFMQTGEGTIRVEINDPAIEVAIRGTGIVLKQADQGKNVKLSPGDHTLVVQRGNFQFETNKLILKRGDDVTVRVDLLAGEVQVRQGETVLGQKRLPLSADLVAVPSAKPAPLDGLAEGSAAAQQRQLEFVKSTGLPLEVKSKATGISMRLIPPGTFTMGSPENEPRRRADWEGRQAEVTLTKGFYVGSYEVTQAAWEAVMGGNPSNSKGAAKPVEQVSWNACQAFLKKLCEQEGVPAGTYRLLTEAEWEYTSRAGTQTAHCFGPTLSVEQANFNSKKGRTKPVGSYVSNSWGVYDMHGNVWEWCSDRQSLPPLSGGADPSGPAQGTEHMIRGGSWNSDVEFLRSATRGWNTSTHQDVNLGFRLARALNIDTPPKASPVAPPDSSR